jgi:hypothetical protein
LATYGSISNFNSIETSTNLTVGGTLTAPVVSSTGSITLTGDLTITGNVDITDAVEAIAGSSVTAATADLDRTSYQAVTSTSGFLKKYLLDSPVDGAIKRILINNAGAGDVYIYASASSAGTAYFGANTSGNIIALTSPSCLYFELLGVSTSKWILTRLSTLNNGTTGTLAITSTNS